MRVAHAGRNCVSVIFNGYGGTEPVNIPAILLLDDNAADMERTERELRSRYSTDYEVFSTMEVASALNTLQTLKNDGREVAIVFADLWMPEMTGIDFLKQAHDLHPLAKRVLLTNWGDRNSRDAILQAATFGWIDQYFRKPFSTPDEYFHRFVTELLDGWRRQYPIERCRILRTREKALYKSGPPPYNAPFFRAGV